MIMSEIERLYDIAVRYLSNGHYNQAIDYLRKVLSEEPDHAEAHAALSMSLYSMNRLYAAQYEAGVALELEPDLPIAHYAMTWTMICMRNFKKAEEHLTILLEIEPNDPENYRVKAHLLELKGKKDVALGILLEALALDPESPKTKTELGSIYIDQGNIQEAEKYAREVLEEYPEYQDALTLMGKVLLQKGQIDDAKEHAMWALRQNPSDHQTLYLMSAIKARTNIFLGLWWRFQTKMSQLGDIKTIMFLLAAFMLAQIFTIFSQQNGAETTAEVIRYVWLGLCIYTWVGPTIFERALKKELAGVELDQDF